MDSVKFGLKCVFYFSCLAGGILAGSFLAIIILKHYGVLWLGVALVSMVFLFSAALYHLEGKRRDD